MPGGELASVMVRLTADASDFINGMDQATGELTAFAETAGIITGAGLAITGTLTAATEYASKFETEVFNLSQTTGIATETISALNVAAQAQGKGLESIQVAFRKLGQEAEDSLISPYSKAAATFHNLGVLVTDVDGKVKPLNQLFLEVDDALSKVNNTTLKWGMASDLFGRSSASLIPVLAGGVKMLEQWKKVAEETGVSVTESQAEQGKSFQLMQNMAENSLRGVAVAIGGILMPSFMELAKGVEDALNAFRGFITTYPRVIDLTLALGTALIGSGGLALGFVAVKGAALLMNTMFGETAANLQVLNAHVIVTESELADLDAEFAVIAEFMNTVNAETAAASAGFSTMGRTVVIVTGQLTGMVDTLQLVSNEWLMLSESSIAAAEEMDALVARADALAAAMEVAAMQMEIMHERIVALKIEMFQLGIGAGEAAEETAALNEGFVILETSLATVNGQTTALVANISTLNGETGAAGADLGSMGAGASTAATDLGVLDAEIIATTGLETAMGEGAVMSGAALVGLGGVAIGVGAVVFNLRYEWAEFVTYLMSSIDSVLAPVIGKLGDLAGKLGLMGVHDSLKTLQFDLEESSKSWADESENFARATAEVNPMDTMLKQLMVSLKGVHGATTDNMSAQREHDMAVKALVESVTMEKGGFDALTPALEKLMKLHVDDYLIVDKLGPKIIEYTNARLAEGKTINSVLQYYRDLAIEVNTVKDAEEKMFTARVIQAVEEQKLRNYATALMEKTPADIEKLTKAWEKHYGEMAKLMEDDARGQEDEAAKRIHAISDILAAENTYATKLKDIKQAEIDMKIAADTQYLDYVGRVSMYEIKVRDGASEAELAILKEQIQKSLQLWHQYDNEYNRLLKLEASENTRYWQQFITTQDQAQAKMEVGMAHAMANLSTGFSQALAHDIVTWDGWGKSIVNIGQNVAEQLLQSFMNGFLNPLTNALSQVGRSLSNLLFQAIGTALTFINPMGAGASDVFTSGISFAAQGAVLDKDMPIFAHAGEMILPPDLSKGMQDMIHGNDGPSRLDPSDSRASMMPSSGAPAYGPSMMVSPDASSMIGNGTDMSSTLNAIREALLGINSSSMANDRTQEESISILSSILNAIKQGQKIMVDGKVLGQTAAIALRGRTLVSGSVVQAGR